MLRTIELILGLPPMSQYDAGATPMWECFTSAIDTTTFTALAASYDITEKNQKKNSLSQLSDSFNFKVEDAAPDVLFSEVIWKTVKGIDSKMPAPVRSAFILHKKEVEDSEDD